MTAQRRHSAPSPSKTLPRDCACHGLDAGVQVSTDFFLGKAQHSPGQRLELDVDDDVSSDLGVNGRAPGGGYAVMKAVPQFPVDEDSQAARGEGHVRPARSLPVGGVEPQAAAVELTPQSNFDLRAAHGG